MNDDNIAKKTQPPTTNNTLNTAPTIHNPSKFANDLCGILCVTNSLAHL